MCSLLEYTSIAFCGASFFHGKNASPFYLDGLSWNKNFMQTSCLLLSWGVTKTRWYNGSLPSILARKSFREPKWLLPNHEEGMLVQQDGTYRMLGTNPSGHSIFKMAMKTSNDYNSGLSSNAGILLTILGEHGTCFMHRISPLVKERTFAVQQDIDQGESSLHQHRFQRGSVDEVAFTGPDVGKIEAIWVAPEAGKWKMESMRMMVFMPNTIIGDVHSLEANDYTVFQYDFKDVDVLLGGDTLSAGEFKPCKTSQVSYADSLLFNSSGSNSELDKSIQEKRARGMQEYTKLKASLLSYTAILTTAGTAVSFVVGSKEIATGFGMGGVLGILYLVSLQKAVDELPAPVKKVDPSIVNTSESQIVDFKAPLTRFTAILGFSALAVKAVANIDAHTISKEMLLAGAAGFLMSKVATVLASQKSFLP